MLKPKTKKAKLAILIHLYFPGVTLLLLRIYIAMATEMASCVNFHKLLKTKNKQDPSTGKTGQLYSHIKMKQPSEAIAM